MSRREGAGTNWKLAALVGIWPAIALGQVDASTSPLQKRLLELDLRASDVGDLSASFEERKHTALLKKPLVSTGRVRIVGTRARWDTERPHRSVMVMDPATIRIYYPDRGALEVYDIDEKLARLAISPLPRFSSLRDHFVIEEISLKVMGNGLSAEQHLALRMTPKDDALRDYLSHVDVALDTKTTFVVRARIIDPDGDETELAFRDVRTNTGLSKEDVELAVPAGTTVSRPLAGLRGETQAPGAREQP